MYLQFVPANVMEIPLSVSMDIPKHMLAYFIPRCERSFYSAHSLEYLEQYYGGPERSICWIDLQISLDTPVNVIVSGPILIVTHLLQGNSIAAATDQTSLREGFSYLMYLSNQSPGKLIFKKGYYRLVYCVIQNSDLSHIDIENERVKAIVRQFQDRGTDSMIGKASCIRQRALYNMWLVQQCEETFAFRQMYFKVRCLDLLLEYLKHLSLGDDAGNNSAVKNISRSEKVFEAKKILDELDDGKLDSATLAKQVGMNPQLLARLFKDNFDITIGQYQIEARFERARRLLVTTDIPVSDIAMAAGYEDEWSLTRLFVAKTGDNPKAYRNKHGK